MVGGGLCHKPNVLALTDKEPRDKIPKISDVLRRSEMIAYLIACLLGGLITYGLSLYLNKTYFDKAPAKSIHAWAMAICYCLAMLLVFSLLRYLSTLIFVQVSIDSMRLDQGTLMGSLALAFFFYKRLNKKSIGIFEVLSTGGNIVATFDSKTLAEEYVEKNQEMNFSIKEK